eukprot:Skav207181  [mRNA]  locus=scaffold573:810099:810846:- [translate_table: standard]
MPLLAAETSVPAYGMALLASAAVGLLAAGAQRTLKVARKATEVTHGIKFSYSMQKDAYADYEAIFVNSVGYLPDGTPMNAAGNALNHPETMQPDMHVPGSPLPASYYAAEVGYLVDGTDMRTAGNLSVQAPPPMAAAAAPAAPVTPPPAAPTVTAAFTSASTEVIHGIKFSYSMQKDAYADYEFLNDVGLLA